MELIVKLYMTEEQIKTALRMEDNYSGIHKKVLWDKTKITKREGNIRQPKASLRRKYGRLLRSFGDKIKDPTRANCFIDRVAKKEGIPIPRQIKPVQEDINSLIGNLASQGIEFEVIE